MIHEKVEVLKRALTKNNILFIDKYRLNENSYSKTGCEVSALVIPKNQSQFIEVIELIKDQKLEFKVIGETTNIIFLDSVTYGVFVSTKLLTQFDLLENNTAIVQVGKSLPDLVREMSMRSISGFEGLEGIPGSIGGAITMNAGAYGYFISDKLVSVKFLNKNNEVVSSTKSELEFSSRNSIFKENPSIIILEATFKVEYGDLNVIASNVEKFHIARHVYQEWVFPNLGSIFSCPQSIYQDLAKSNRRFGFKLSFLSKLFYNKFFRFYNRKKPSNNILNKLVSAEFRLEQFNGMYSHKNINTFTNKNYNTTQILSYIFNLSKNLSNDSKVENELVTNAILKINDDEQYNKSICLYEKTVNK